MTRGWSQGGNRFNGTKVYKTFEGMVRGMQRRNDPIERATLYRLPRSGGFAFLEPGKSIFALPLGSIAIGLYSEDKVLDINSDTMRRFHGYAATT